MTRTALPLLALAAAMTLLAGCATTTDGSGSMASSAKAPVRSSSKQSAPAPDPVKVDPCSLVTKAEADAITGVTVMAPVRSIELCTFPTPTSGTVAQLEVYVGPGAKKMYDIDNITLKHEFKDVPGVGDEAHLEGGAIFFKVATTWYALRLVRLDDADIESDFIKLAATVAGRV